jgi:hypothetical protein
MSLFLRIEDEGLHERLAIPLTTIPFTKIFKRSDSGKLQLIKGWKSRVAIPRLLAVLRLFVKKYGVESYFVDELCFRFEDAPDADKDVSFSMAEPPYFPASFATITNLANAANATASAGDEYALPPSVCLNVRFDGESGLIVRTALLKVQPSHPSSVMLTPSPVSSRNPASLRYNKKNDDDSQATRGRSNDDFDARQGRAAFLLYRGLDPKTPRNVLPTPRGTIRTDRGFRYAQGRDALAVKHNHFDLDFR